MGGEARTRDRRRSWCPNMVPVREMHQSHPNHAADARAGGPLANHADARARVPSRITLRSSSRLPSLALPCPPAVGTRSRSCDARWLRAFRDWRRVPPSDDSLRDSCSFAPVIARFAPERQFCASIREIRRCKERNVLCAPCIRDMADRALSQARALRRTRGTGNQEWSAPWISELRANCRVRSRRLRPS